MTKPEPLNPSTVNFIKELAHDLFMVEIKIEDGDPIDTGALIGEMEFALDILKADVAARKERTNEGG